MMDGAVVHAGSRYLPCVDLPGDGVNGGEGAVQLLLIDPVIDIAAHALALDQLRLVQDLQVVGDGRLRNPQFLRQLADVIDAFTVITRRQQRQNMQPRQIPQRLHLLRQCIVCHA